MALLQLLFLLVAIRAAQQVKADQPDNRSSLHLLNILPFPDSRPNTGWDRAYELIPAAQLAVDQINNASHILPGYKLNLVNVDTDACAVRYVSKGLVNTYAKVFTPENSLNVVGFMGLFCSRVTDAITSAFGGPNVAYLQLTGSTTPLHRRVKYPWLVHLLSSTTILHDAIVKIVREFGWTTVSGNSCNISKNVQEVPLTVVQPNSLTIFTIASWSIVVEDKRWTNQGYLTLR